MTRIGYWLVASAVVGVIGGLLPWFHPADPVVGFGTWHSWDGPWVCLIVSVVFALAALAGSVILRETAGRLTGSTSTAVAQMLDRTLWFSLAGIAALMFQWWNLPNDYVVCPAYLDASTCGLAGTSSWIDDPGATRGVQLGWWVSLAACVMVLVGMLWLTRQGDRVAGTILRSRGVLAESSYRSRVPPDRGAVTIRRGGSAKPTFHYRRCTNVTCLREGWDVIESRCTNCGGQTAPVRP